MPNDLTFRDVVDSHVADPRFLARPWLADDVAARLEDPGCRLVLLTASPGAGKSAFVAQLAHEHPRWPVYFVRRDQIGPLMDVGAHSFLMRVGFQLAMHHPDLFKPEQVKVTVEQRVGEATGSLVAAEIDRLLASPFFTTLVRVKQDVERSAGKITAVHVGEYVQDPRLIPLEDLQHMALLDPASALLRTEPSARIVVLVDALDEIRYHPSSQSLLDWLAHAPELPANVRLVLTSRPEEELLGVLRAKQERWLRTLEITGTDPRVQEDSHKYVARLVPPHFAGGDENLDEIAAEFPARVLARADGNLGYLGAIARELDRLAAGLAHPQDDATAIHREALVGLLALTTLPESLEGLYAFFLNQLRSSLEGVGVAAGHDPDTGEALFRSAWAAVYRPILAVLAIAFEPLRSDQIKKYARVTAEGADVIDALQRLRQFLSLTERRFGLYHATVAEFLTSSETRDDIETAALYVEPELWHAQVVRACRGKHRSWAEVDWAELDDYGLEHLVRHQSHLPLASEDRDIDAVIGAPLMWATHDRFGSLASFRRDVELAVEAAKIDAEPILPLLRNALIFGNVGSASQAVPGDVLRLLAGTGDDGRIEQALDQVALIPDAETRASILLDLGRDLLPTKQEKAAEILRMVIETAEFIGVGRYALGKADFLGRSSLALAEAGAAEAALRAGARAAEIALALPNGDVFAPSVLHLVARARFRLGETAGADEALDWAKRIIDGMEDERSLGSRLALLSERVGVLATMDRWADLRREIEAAGAVPPGFYRSAAFSGFIRELLPAAENGQAGAAVLELLRWRDDLEPGPQTDAAVAGAVRILGLGGATVEAIALAAHVIAQGDASAVAAVAQALAGVPDARALEEAITALTSVPDERQRIQVLIAAGPSVGRIDGSDVLARLSPWIDQLSPAGQAVVYVQLAEAIEEQSPEQAATCYKRAAGAARDIPEPDYQASALKYIEDRRAAEPAAELDVREVLRSAYAIANERNVARAMCTIARGLSVQGRQEQAREVLHAAAEAASRYVYSDFRAVALADVARAMGETEDVEALEALCAPIGLLPDEWLKVEPMAALAGGFEQCGRTSAAEEQATAALTLARGVLHEDDLLLPVESVVAPLAGLSEILSAEAFRGLVEAVAALDDQRQRANGVKAMIPGAVARRDAALLERLGAASGSLSDEGHRMDVAVALATAALELGDVHRLEAVVTEIARLHDEEALAARIEDVAYLLSDPRLSHLMAPLLEMTASMDDAVYGARAAAALAEPARASGDVERARALAENALTNTLGVVEWSGSQSWDEDDESGVADALEELVGAVGVSLGRLGAADLLDELLRGSRPALPLGHAARVVERIAENVAVVDGSELVAVVDCLATAAATVDAEEPRSDAMLSVLAAYAESGARKAGQEAAKTATALLAGVRNDDDRSRGMADVAYALHRLDLDDDAEQAFAAALDAARQSGREAVYDVIGRYGEATDDPERLIRISRTLVDVDSWWSYRPPGSATAFVAAVGDNLAKRA